MTDKKKILVIDDDPDIHDFCRMVLEKEGYNLASASSGQEGQAAMTANPADLVILDVMMEAADAGFETAKWFARSHPEVPVIMLSSIADAADSVFDTTTLKVAALVNKPMAPQDLLDKVKKFLGA